MDDKLNNWVNLHPVFHRLLLVGIGACFIYGVGYVVGKFIFNILHP
jgi:predicted membrane protein